MVSNKNKLRKIISGVAALTILSAGAASIHAITNLNAKAAQATLSGDVTLDGSVGVADVVALKKHLVGQTDLNDTALLNSDLNSDNIINVFDAILLKRVVASSGIISDTNTITLNSSSISFSGSGASLSADSKTITISEPGTYSVSGESNDCQIVVDVDKTAYADGLVELSLEGASMTHSSNSPIYVASIGDKCVINSKKGTVNTISDGTSYTNADADCGAIYSKDDLTFKGSGTLNVNGNCQDGIVSKNDVKINNGTINVTAADDGIRGKDSVRIGNPDDLTANGGKGDFSKLSVTVKTTAGDGIKSTNAEETERGTVEINGGTVNVNSYADGIQAEQEFVMNGGDITIYTYEGSGFTGTVSGSTGSWGGPGGGMSQEGNSNKVDISAKGIKAVGLYDTDGTTYLSGGNITINAGTLNIDSSDDCLHCGGNLSIFGGNMKLASADDAVHSDSDLTLGKEGGSENDFGIYITACYEGIEGNNIYQHSGTVVVKSTDDGYNAAGGADGSGTISPGGWGGPGGGMGSTSSGNEMTITGGIAIVQASIGDHDAFDSNGNINISGGCVIANGQEPIDCGDGYTENITGGTVAEISSQGVGSIAANTQFTIADSSGNVIVSFTTMQAMGSPSLNNTNLKVYTGGTISGGTDLITSDTDGSQITYASGTISGGTEVSTSGGGSQGGGPGVWSFKSREFPG